MATNYDYTNIKSPTTYGILASEVGAIDTSWAASNISSGTFTFAPAWSSIMTIKGTNGQEMVRINADCTVEFSEQYDPDEAARIFWEAIDQYIPAKVKKLEMENRELQAEIECLQQQLARPAPAQTEIDEITNWLDNVNFDEPTLQSGGYYTMYVNYDIQPFTPISQITVNFTVEEQPDPAKAYDYAMKGII